MSDPVDPNLARLLPMARALAQPYRAERALESNQAKLRVVKFQGHFAQWHSHDEDECYVILEGEMLVELESRPAVRLVVGDAYVVKAGTVHRPFAVPQALVLLVT